jgi:hypothetical protein
MGAVDPLAAGIEATRAFWAKPGKHKQRLWIMPLLLIVPLKVSTAHHGLSCPILPAVKST